MKYLHYLNREDAHIVFSSKIERSFNSLNGTPERVEEDFNPRCSQQQI